MLTTETIVIEGYTVLLEQGPEGGWGGHVPDLPVVAAFGDTKEEVETLIREAIPLHIEDLKAK
jgi:predicted RNase H-like HicB family nuclease